MTPSDTKEAEKESMKHKINKKNLKPGTNVIITHPAFGTLSMEVKKITGKYVEGLVWLEEGYYQPNMPEDYHGEYEYMNFPITCIREVL